jgi:hypothetical protein
MFNLAAKGTAMCPPEFTAYEARKVQPLVAHRPVMSWVYSIFSVTTFYTLILSSNSPLALRALRLAMALCRCGGVGAQCFSAISNA